MARIRLKYFIHVKLRDTNHNYTVKVNDENFVDGLCHVVRRAPPGGFYMDDRKGKQYCRGDDTVQDFFYYKLT